MSGEREGDLSGRVAAICEILDALAVKDPQWTYGVLPPVLGGDHGLVTVSFDLKRVMGTRAATGPVEE